MFQIARHVITYTKCIYLAFSHNLVAKLSIHNFITLSPPPPPPPCIKTTDYTDLLAFLFFFFGGESVISITSIGFCDI